MLPPMPAADATRGHSGVSVAGEFKDYDKHPHPGVSGPQPLGLGIRVPAIVVSPWSRGGYVCSQVFDHTSTLKFLEKRFGVQEPNISDWRRAVSGDLTSCFDFKTPNADTRGHRPAVHRRLHAAPGPCRAPASPENPRAPNPRRATSRPKTSATPALSPGGRSAAGRGKPAGRTRQHRRPRGGLHHPRLRALWPERALALHAGRG
jgi:phospholipase C